MSILEFAEHLRERAVTLRAWTGDDRSAHIYEKVASELITWNESRANELLTLAEAEVESGYSRSHLGRLVRTGKLRNHGGRTSPRVRRGELPKRVVKAAPLPKLKTGTNLPGTSREQIARSIVNRRKVNDGKSEAA